MRFDSGPDVDEDDEDDAHETRQVLVDRFDRWLTDHPEHRGARPWDADLILSWKWGYGDGDYGRWTRADVDELLLEHLPRKLAAAPEEAASVPESIAAFAAFLEDEGLLDADGDPAKVIADRALAQRRAFLDAMAEPSRFGPAKHLFGSFDPTGDVDLDQAALDEAMAAFNELSPEERGAILGLDGDGSLDPEEVGLPALPLRDLPTIDEITPTADEAPLLRRIEELHAALGPSGVRLTKAGNLTLADGRRLVAATGVADRVEGVRSTTEMPRLFALVQVALLAGATEVAGDRLRAVGAWASVPAGRRWQRAVHGALDAGAATLAFGARTPRPQQLAELADQMAFHLLATLWFAEEPMPIDAFADMAREAAATVGAPFGPAGALLGPDHLTRITRARIDDVVATLTDAGVVVVAPDGRLSYSDAGPRLVAADLAVAGFAVLLPEEVGALDADGLVDALIDRDQDDAALAAQLWTSRHDPADRARELAEALTKRPEPARTIVAFSLLEAFGPAAVDPVRDVLLDGPVAGHAWMLLAQHGLVDYDDAPPELVAQAGIDLFLGTADLGSPADAIELLLGNLSPHEHLGLIDTMAAGHHPRTTDLLELIAQQHPDDSIAAHARKAALRRRTRHIALDPHSSA